MEIDSIMAPVVIIHLHLTEVNGVGQQEASKEFDEETKKKYQTEN